MVPTTALKQVFGASRPNIVRLDAPTPCVNLKIRWQLVLQLKL